MVRAHGAYHECSGPGLSPAGRPVLHVTPPSRPFPICPLSNKAVSASNKSLKKLKNQLSDSDD